MALPHQLVARGKPAPTANAVENVDFPCIEIGADRLVANGAGLAKVMSRRCGRFLHKCGDYPLSHEMPRHGARHRRESLSGLASRPSQLQ